MTIASHPKLDGFAVLQTSYKTVGDHGIRADILVPQTSHAGKRPTILHFHGGGLVTSDSLYMDFWPHWLSDLALKHGAVIISANYRLMPGVTSAEIYEDIEDFWTWVHSPALADVLAALSTPTQCDLDRVLTAGSSAGGLLSISLGLAHPTQIRAATAGYPFVDPASEYYNAPRAHPPFGRHMPKSLIQETEAVATPGRIESSNESWERLAYMLAIIEHGTIGALYARGAEGVPREVLYPMARLEQPGLDIPRGGIAVIHGRQDSVVPVVDSERFIARAQVVTKDLPGREGVVLAVRDGDHGFDTDIRLEEEEWLQDTIKRAVEVWLE
ncbi:uncharacterized protein N7459_000475 [Penicillium hispanicum]|uniref:uncharacterized protein n=1 Tax=Penicillium hispanicum TaxID=1080232 RepID=UPI0025407D23|nr:uncharacterized protein N7459_000475 [Penicillium hispanicum]KAJ5594267.1 hypothetical protein N7459_000475 [Penicillium hispanicum]